MADLTGLELLVPGLFCAVFSVVNVWLVARIAGAVGATAREAGLAAVFMACAGSQFYYAQFLLPYDAAMTFGLLAMWVGWAGQGWARSLGCGLLASLGFLTYNGSWLFGATVLTGHVLLSWPQIRQLLGRAGLAGLGLFLPIGGCIGAAWILAGTDLLGAFLQFSRSINQGDFGRGWRLIGEYFWAAEGWNFVLGAAVLLGLTVRAVFTRRWDYGMHWVAAGLCLLAGLLLGSDGWHKFVIYGRTARQMVPLVCLAAAFAWERGWRSGGWSRVAAGVLLILGLVQAAANQVQPLRQVYPQEFKDRAAKKISLFRAGGESRQLVVVHVDHLLGRDGVLNNLPDHETMLAADNPLQFTPFLFEGFTEDFRRFLRGKDIRMRLLALNGELLTHPSDLNFPYPGFVRLTLRLPQDRPGHHEPVVVTGRSGAADMIYLIYDLPGAVRLGFDHWGISGFLSDPVAVDYSQPVVLTLSTGPLQGPAGEGQADGKTERHWLYAEVNGQVVWSQAQAFHPALADEIFYGRNLLGGSTCEPAFTGTILGIESIPTPEGADGSSSRDPVRRRRSGPECGLTDGA